MDSKQVRRLRRLFVGIGRVSPKCQVRVGSAEDFMLMDLVEKGYVTLVNREGSAASGKEHHTYTITETARREIEQ